MSYHSADKTGARLGEVTYIDMHDHRYGNSLFNISCPLIELFAEETIVNSPLDAMKSHTILNTKVEMRVMESS